MIRVLHAAATMCPRAGGLTEAVRGMACAQAAAGLRVTLAVTPRAGEERAALERCAAAGVDVRAFGPAASPLRWRPGLGRALRALAAASDVVHAHGLWEEVQYRAALGAAAAGKPLVVSPHGMLDPWSLAQSRWKKRLYLRLRLRRRLDAAAALHYTTAREAALAAPLRLKPPAIVEPLGIDRAEFDPPPSVGRRERAVLFLARIHPKKGLDLLIPAFAAGAPADAILVVAGPDDAGHGAEVARLAERHGVAGRVRFPGMLRGADRVAALAAAEVFVLPSRQENFGIAVAESLAAGTPVVISDQVNLADDLLAAGMATVVPLEVAALAAAIRAHFAGPQADRDRLRRTALGLFAWDQLGIRWAGHYEHLIAAGRAR